MENDKNKISIAEVRGRLFESIFDMSEAETRDLQKKLEKRAQPKYEERRKHPRERAFILIDCISNKCNFSDFIQNISAGGLYLETQIPLLIDQELSMTFSLPNAEDPIKITGEIVRVDSKGIGIQFDELIEKVLIGTNLLKKKAEENESFQK